MSTTCTSTLDALTTDCLAAGAELPCGDCNACIEHAYTEACSREETAALVGMAANVDASNDDDDDDNNTIIRASVGGGCPGGCHAGMVADSHGPSAHNPTGLEPCAVCG